MAGHTSPHSQLQMKACERLCHILWKGGGARGWPRLSTFTAAGESTYYGKGEGLVAGHASPHSQLQMKACERPCHVLWKGGGARGWPRL